MDEKTLTAVSTSLALYQIQINVLLLLLGTSESDRYGPRRLPTLGE